MATDFNNIVLPVYVINLKERTERLSHIQNQFENKPEFDVTIVEACKHTIGAVGLWKSIQKVINLAIQNDDDVIIICEDDHSFTEYYSKEYLIENIIEAHQQHCDILSGGIGFFNHAVPLTKNRYWIDTFCNTQFIVVFKKIYEKILSEPFRDTDFADLKLSELTSHKMVLYPFISYQHDFGYSDITAVHNQKKGLITEVFKKAAEKLALYHRAYEYYF